MPIRKKAVFSSDGEFFAFANEHGLLKIWETSSSTIKQEYVLHSHVNLNCCSLIWGPSKYEISIADEPENILSVDNQFLVLGTLQGEILLYDFSIGKLYQHFDITHADSVNDLCWSTATNCVYSCSTDKCIAVFDITTGNLKMKWEADEEPIYSVSAIDGNNLLSASTTITWWNINDQTRIKIFSGHDSAIMSLLPVNSMDIQSNSYFLSAAVGETRISAWHLQANSKSAVASFNLPDDLVDIDVTRNFSKEKPMFLSTVMKSGSLLLFKHVLNGKTKNNLLPQMTLRVVSKVTDECTGPSPIPVVASKFMSDFCVIAYGSYENPTFEKVKIVDCPKTLTLARDKPLECHDSSANISEVKLFNKLGEYISVNGTLPTVDSSISSPKRKKSRGKSRDLDIGVAHSKNVEMAKNTLRSESPDDRRSASSSPRAKKKHKETDKESPKSENVCRSDSEESIELDSSNIVSILTRGLETEDRALINVVLQCSDHELIKKSIENLPLHRVNIFLKELHKRFNSEDHRYIHSIRKWLKEILHVHLPNIATSSESLATLDVIKEYIDRKQVNKTLSKMHILRGLLNIQRIQNVSSADSNTEEVKS